MAAWAGCWSNKHHIDMTDVDECAEGMSTCDPISTECVNVPGGYFCRCRHGFRSNDSSLTADGGPQWSCIDVDECSGWGGGHRCPTGATCRNTAGSYDCVCDAGHGGDCDEITSK